MTPSTRRPWPLGLLGMLALVALVENQAGRSSERLTTITASAWEYAGGQAAGAVGCEVIAFGDSQVKHGVAPRVLERGLGGKAFNLAITGGPMAGHFLLLRRVLEAGGRPGAVLINGEGFDFDPYEMGRNWPELATLPESLEIAWAGRDAGFFTDLALSRLLTTYKARVNVRAWLAAGLGGWDKGRVETTFLPLYRRNWRQNAGAELNPPWPAWPEGDGRAEEIARSDYRPDVWKSRPINRAYAEKFVALAGERGVGVYWLLPPLHPGVQALRERYGAYGAYTAYLRGLVARHANLTVVESRYAGFSPDLLKDMTHLNVTGALAFTHALATVIEARTPANPGPRWVELPALKPGEAGRLAAEFADVVEDLDESALAFKRVERQVARVQAGGETRRAK